MRFPESYRECLKSMARNGGANITVVRAALLYIEFLEAENLRLLEAKNEAVRESYRSEPCPTK